jgi:hypothetical protein
MPVSTISPTESESSTGVPGAGTQQVTLSEPCHDDWCHVAWPSGQGWVYTGPDYPSLQLP